MTLKTENSASSTPFEKQYQSYKAIIESALPNYLGSPRTDEESYLFEAAAYSLMAGGKRIRPVLMLSVAETLGLQTEPVLPFACAVEMIHTYSLVHDDLPAMDDDDLRRGRPTCHKVYGEAMAILAGDFLLNRAYEIIMDAIDPDHPETLLAAQMIGFAAGGRGMIGGQVMDLMFETQNVALEELEMMHQKKTGALLSVCVNAAAVLARANQIDSSALSTYGQSIGLAFQIRDDMLDVTASAQQMGKTPDKDQRDGKTTFVSVLGFEQAQERLMRTDQKARLALQTVQERHDCSFLSLLTDFLLIRDY